MHNKIKYDFGISCAEEDLPVAEKLAEALKKVGVSYYLYTEHIAENLGKNLLQVTWDIYSHQCRFILMMISQTYIKKHWSDMESQISQLVRTKEEAYIIPLRLEDDVVVDGLSKNICYVRWKNDPDELAAVLRAKRDTAWAQYSGGPENSLPGVSIHAGKAVITHGDIGVQNNTIN